MLYPVGKLLRNPRDYPQETPMEKDSAGFDIAKCEVCKEKYVVGVMVPAGRDAYLCHAHA